MATDYERDAAVRRWVEAGQPGQFVLSQWTGGRSDPPQKVPQETPPPVVRPAAGGGGTTRPMGPIGDLSMGEYTDFFAIAREVLSRLGVQGRDPSDDEIVFFAKSGLNAEGVLAYYSEKSEIIEKQPGIPYGLSMRGYEQRLRELNTAWSSVFPGQPTPGLPGAKASKSEREGSLFGSALRQNISQGEFGETLSKFKTERGRAPSTVEFEERRTRPTYQAPKPTFRQPQGAGVPSAAASRPAVSRKR